MQSHGFLELEAVGMGTQSTARPWCKNRLSQSRRDGAFQILISTLCASVDLSGEMRIRGSVKRKKRSRSDDSSGFEKAHGMILAVGDSEG